MNRVLAKELDAFNRFASWRIACSKSVIWIDGSWLHVFAKDLHRRSVTWKQITPDPVCATKELTDLSHVLERREVLDCLGALGLMAGGAFPLKATLLRVL